jgi:hypothetical protein
MAVELLDKVRQQLTEKEDEKRKKAQGKVINRTRKWEEER